MTHFAQSLTLSLIAILSLMTFVWLLSLALRDASIIDACWGSGFAGVAWLVAWFNAPVGPRGVLLLILVTVWGVRLSAFLLWRNWGPEEDHRYRAMRAHHGANFWWVSLFTVFWLQAAILWFVSLPIQVAFACHANTPLGVLDAIGAVLWAIGFFFESVGDWQLARFKSQPSNAGQVLDGGLWRFTRHPNYFGDFCVWWGIYLVATAGGAWWTVLSPLLMSYLLLKVSGVKLLEQTIADRRPAYAAYQSRTNAFFPAPPRRSPGK